jgi:hypothetical protein
MANPIPAELPGWAIDGRIDADQPARTVKERAARIAGIDGGIGLNHILDRAFRDRVDLAAKGANNAVGQRLVETEWIADRVYLLADLQVVRRANRDGVQHARRCIDVKHSQILVGISSDQPGRPRRVVP